MASDNKPKPPSVSFEDLLNAVKTGYEKDDEEHKNLPKKYEHGEGVEIVEE